MTKRPAARAAISAYLGLVSFMDAQVGRVLDALDAAGLRDSTRILYTSDHGENAGARGLWGKSNHYQEAVRIPMIVAGADTPFGKVVDTPVSLVDVYPTILGASERRSWTKTCPVARYSGLIEAREDRERIVFEGEYHAAGSPSASYMLRKGRFKFIYYVGYAPELFDLEADPEETHNLAGAPEHVATVRDLEVEAPQDRRSEKEDARQRSAASDRASGGPEEVGGSPWKALIRPFPAERSPDPASARDLRSSNESPDRKTGGCAFSASPSSCICLRACRPRQSGDGGPMCVTNSVSPAALGFATGLFF